MRAARIEAGGGGELLQRQRPGCALESLEEPVTPAGMLRVVDLVTDGAGPLWGTTKDATLGDAISTTLAILRPVGVDSTRGARVA